MSSKPAGLSSPPTTTPGRTAAGPPPRLRKPIPSAFARALPRRVSEPTPRLFDGAAASPGPHAKARRWPQERRSPCLLGGSAPRGDLRPQGQPKAFWGESARGEKFPPISAPRKSGRGARFNRKGPKVRATPPRRRKLSAPHGALGARNPAREKFRRARGWFGRAARVGGGAGYIPHHPRAGPEPKRRPGRGIYNTVPIRLDRTPF